MTQDERWLAKRKEVIDFMEKSHSNLLRHRIGEYDMLNWVKSNRKKMNAGKLKVERHTKFQGFDCVRRRV